MFTTRVRNPMIPMPSVVQLIVDGCGGGWSPLGTFRGSSGISDSVCVGFDFADHVRLADLEFIGPDTRDGQVARVAVRTLEERRRSPVLLRVVGDRRHFVADAED